MLGLGVIGLCALIAVAAAATWALQVADSGPQLRDFKLRNLGASSEVFAADGTSLGFISNDVLRTPVPAARIPQVMRNAVIAVEDKRFYEHGGVDPEGIARAALRNISSSGGTQGASTLEMQLIRNLYTGDSARSGIAGFKRKIREARLAQELEKAHPGRRGKDWILNQYINAAPFGTVGGQELLGVEAAARMYFRKSANGLTLKEAALLAGLPQAPSDYSPILHPRAATKRRNEVLRLMEEQGYASPSAVQAAIAAPLGLNIGRYYQRRRESYFFDYVKRELIAKYGKEVVLAGGLKIHTSLDLKMQKAAKQAVLNGVAGTNRSAAIATVDNSTGQVKALASTDSYGARQFDLASQGSFAAGSTFKVMVLMAAIHAGVDPNTTSYDSVPLKLDDPKYGPIDVQTYSHTYMGRSNLVRATLASDNSIYQQLDLDLGPPAVTDAAVKMGIPRSRLHDYPAEALGGLHRGVSPLMMAHAYSTIADGGWRNRLTAIKRVCIPVTIGHYRCDDFKPRRTRVFTDGETNEVTKILEQNVQGGTGTAAQIGCPAAGKTGTVDDFTDAWFVGYTPRLTSAVWVGHADGRYSLGGGAAGGVVAAPIWGAYMKTARGSFCGAFPQPKTPFVPVPFFGRYATDGPVGNTAVDPNATSTTDTTTTETSTTKTGENGPNNQKFPSGQYQGSPKTPTVSPQAPKPTPAKPAPGGDGDGGGAAPG